MRIIARACRPGSGMSHDHPMPAALSQQIAPRQTALCTQTRLSSAADRQSDRRNDSAYLGTWTGSGIGSVLWSSGNVPSPTNPYPGNPSPLSGFQQSTFNVGQAVTSGAVYIAALMADTTSTRGSADFDYLAHRDRGNAGGSAFPLDGLGGLVNLRASPANVSTPADWTYFAFTNDDAAFIADFTTTTVPEPPSVLLFLVAGLGLLAARRRSIERTR